MNKKLTFLEEASSVIDKAIQDEDWFSGFANAVAYLEHFGYWLLRWYCIKKKINVKRKIARLRVNTITLILYLLGLIDTRTYSMMNKTIKERNKLIHPTIAGISYRDRKEKERATELLNDAKFCLEKLFWKIGDRDRP